MNHNSEYEILESQIREFYGRVVWTHKIQEKCSDLIIERYNTIKVCQLILSSLVTTGVFASIFNDDKWLEIISAIVAAILLILNIYTRENNLSEIAQKYASCAASLWNIRESYLSLLTDIRSGSVNPDVIRNKRDQLQQELAKIYENSPRSFQKAYNQASQALNKNEEMTFSDDEINSFLPKQLRKKQQSKED